MERKHLQQGGPIDPVKMQQALDRVAQLGPADDDPLQGLEETPDLPGDDPEDVVAEFHR